MLQEEYSDIPWAQKLGTFRGNEFDQAIILPFLALPSNNVAYCTYKFGKQPTPATGPAGQAWEAKCMIETGIVNVMTTLRTDTLYDSNQDYIKNVKKCDPSTFKAGTCTKTFSYCPDPSGSPPQACIEVNLQQSSYWIRSSGGKTPTIALEKRPIGTESPQPTDGWIFSDGNTYAPQIPWYMSHYCESLFLDPDSQGAVCYGDYLSPNSNGFNNTDPAPGTPKNLNWPNGLAAWSVFPSTDKNHCVPGQTPAGVCQVALAGFDLAPVPPVQSALFFVQENLNLFNNGSLAFDKCPDPIDAKGSNLTNCLGWFNNAVASFRTNISLADFQRHFPWKVENKVTWTGGTGLNVYPQAVSTPFVGEFTFTPADSGCALNTLHKFFPLGCTPSTQRADHFLYPRQCMLTDLAATDTNVKRLRNCSLAYEMHPNGWIDEWPDASWLTNGMKVNSYGRTIFLFAGVPGMQLPVSYYKDPNILSGLSAYERVHNSSVFSLYLPIANEADYKMAFNNRNYSDGGDEFFHDVLMTNHMESTPEEFTEGLRGKALWHNEYRSKEMYIDGTNSPDATHFPAVTFAAAFDPNTAPAPFHNSTCDGCHVRNGSGIPINTARMLALAIQGPPVKPGVGCQTNKSCFMTPGPYQPNLDPIKKDYLFSGTITPMKLVFFDLNRRTVNQPVYSNPAAFKGQYYSTAIMNFYGDSFHVTDPTNYNYTWNYDNDPGRMANRLVVTTDRKNLETGQTYFPMQVSLVVDPKAHPLVGTFKFGDNTSPNCTIASDPKIKNVPWPTSCDDLSNDALTNAIYGATPTIGFMLLNGKRLSNLGAIEAIPNASILSFQQAQIAALTTALTKAGNTPTVAKTVATAMAGQVQYNSGTRADSGENPRSPDNKLACVPSSPATCWIGRFGWIGDRVSLEDQVANAAFVEMGMTSREGFKDLYPSTQQLKTFPVRYNVPDCGLANQTCVASVNPLGTPGNGDLSEADIGRMADYARWLGSPTRSEFTASLPEVIAGEQVFRKAQCSLCHVIDKIPITNPNDTMMPAFYQKRLAVVGLPGQPASPFLSYLGTDLLMHDMGYLSQVAIFRNVGFRDKYGMVPVYTGTGTDYSQYVQKIRTPPLKGLRFNRLVTNSLRNTITATPPNPACDFLLHDGRACDALEAAFLHDGPEIKWLGVIDGPNGLNKLTAPDLQNLRAFLYSL